MAHSKRAEHASLSPEIARQIDKVCDRFEADWKAGWRPRIEDFLGDLGEPERTTLLRDLLAVELEYRRSNGESPKGERYLPRFPGHEAIVQQAFTQSEPNQSIAAENPPTRTMNVEMSETRGADAVFGTKQPIASGKKLGRFELIEVAGQGCFGRFRDGNSWGDGIVILWNTDSGQRLLKVLVRSACMSFGRDGKVFAIGDGPMIRLWETNSWTEIRKFEGHSATVVSLAFHPNGKRLASSSRDGTVRIWDVETAKKLLTLSEGDTDTVCTVAFSPDGRLLSSGNSTNGIVRLWKSQELEATSAAAGKDGQPPE